ncbi:hypothetical protein HZS_4625, partial [Henneguya salminicola]
MNILKWVQNHRAHALLHFTRESLQESKMLMMKGSESGSSDKMTRIAIVNGERCKPKKCHLECKRNCPVVRQGKLCIEVENSSKIAFISEPLCIGCGICVKKCPLEAIKIVNLPSSLEKDTTHRYGPNSFKLHRLPTPRRGKVLGLVGTNGIGKSTALKILSGKIKLNLGRYVNPPDWQEILTFFRGSELQNYFTKLLEDKLNSIIKPQYVDQIPKIVKGTVQDLLKKKDELGKFDQIIVDYEMTNILDRGIDQLSGGELQRFACAIISVQENDIYMFDEPSSYLDVRQRLKVAENIRKITDDDKYVIVVEHDLSVLDYLSDYICVLYGVPSVYGVVTLPFSVKEGINVFLDGFVPTENLRFRETSLVFKFLETMDSSFKSATAGLLSYPALSKKYDHFELEATAGEFGNSEIIVMLGENGTGKTTFIRKLSEYFNPPQESITRLTVSYKPQKISPRSEESVKTMLYTKINDSMNNAQFYTDVVKPLQLEQIFDQIVKNLSGGELQRVALALCLGKNADIYLLDEPSAYLDSEQLEHDFIMATYLADKVIVFEGTPSIRGVASSPQPMITGVNAFLKQMQITFRRDANNYRPRINKRGSVKTTEKFLQEFFEKYGHVKDVKIVSDRYNGVSKNFGFVTFKSKNVANKLIKMRTEFVDGNYIRIQRAYIRNKNQYNSQSYNTSNLNSTEKSAREIIADDSGIVADMQNLSLSISDCKKDNSFKPNVFLHVFIQRLLKVRQLLLPKLWH